MEGSEAHYQKVCYFKCTVSIELDAVKFHLRYGNKSVCESEFSFSPSKLFVKTLIISKYN